MFIPRRKSADKPWGEQRRACDMCPKGVIFGSVRGHRRQPNPETRKSSLRQAGLGQQGMPPNLRGSAPNRGFGQGSLIHVEPPHLTSEPVTPWRWSSPGLGSVSSNDSVRRVVVYSAIIGSYDTQPVVRSASSDIEFLLVSDSPVARTPWKQVQVDRYWKDNKLTSGYIKTHPHLFVSDDSITVWVDANLGRLDLNSDSIRTMVDETPVWAFPHLIRSSVKDEARTVINSSLDHSWRVMRHMTRLESLGFPDDVGLSATMFLIRDLADPRVRQLNRTWWRGVLDGSRRDQLSFEPAAWAAGIDVRHLDVDWRVENEWAKRTDHSDPQTRQVVGVTEDQSDPTAFDLGPLPSGYPDPAFCYDEEWTAKDLAVIKAQNAAVVQSGEQLEGNYCHLHWARVGAATPPDPRRGWKREYLRRCMSGVQSVLEVGFNAGHSAAIMLLENPEVRITAVDIGSHAYSRPCADVLAREFGGRLRFLWGDSRTVLEASEGLAARDFDLVHIDGGHGDDVFAHDLGWWLETSNPGGLLLVDDVYAPNLERRIHIELEMGRIRTIDPHLPSSGENQLFVRVATKKASSQRN